MKLEIILKKENDEWIADTNLPGTPPIGRSIDWRAAVGELMHRLATERKHWEHLVEIPGWTVVD